MTRNAIADSHAKRAGRKERSPVLPPLTGRTLLEQVRDDFIGLDTEYRLANGARTARRFLDSAASTLMMGAAHRASTACLEHYSNTHSFTHFSARISTELYAWAHCRILDFCRADQQQYTCVFTGSGSTAGFNRIARVFKHLRRDRDTVLVSLMEHHSNDLPHRKHHTNVISIPCEGESSKLGRVDLVALRDLLETHRQRLNYVAVTAASNVTGIINPIYEIAAMVHEYGAYLVVDGSQLAAHEAVNVGRNANPAENIDVFVFSGHKVYAPGSPGVLVARKELLQALQPAEVGGGMVDRVALEDYQISAALPGREEAGTPNIVGAIRLAAAVEVLDRIGMATISDYEMMLTRQLIAALQSIPEVRLYGDIDLRRVPRTPTVVMNVEGIDHALLAAILNDYFNIAVRNECFCAQPYVREMIREELWELDIDDENHLQADVAAQLGMVRVSLALYSRNEDIEAFVTALRKIICDRDFYTAQYRWAASGTYQHLEFTTAAMSLVNPQRLIDASLSNRDSRHPRFRTY